MHRVILTIGNTVLSALIKQATHWVRHISRPQVRQHGLTRPDGLLPPGQHRMRHEFDVGETTLEIFAISNLDCTIRSRGQFDTPLIFGSPTAMMAHSTHDE